MECWEDWIRLGAACVGLAYMLKYLASWSSGVPDAAGASATDPHAAAAAPSLTTWPDAAEFEAFAPTQVASAMRGMKAFDRSAAADGDRVRELYAHRASILKDLNEVRMRIDMTHNDADLMHKVSEFIEDVDRLAMERIEDAKHRAGVNVHPGPLGSTGPANYGRWYRAANDDD